MSSRLCFFREALRTDPFSYTFRLLAKFSCLWLKDQSAHFFAGCQRRATSSFLGLTHSLAHGPLLLSSEPATVGQVFLTSHLWPSLLLFFYFEGLIINWAFLGIPRYSLHLKVLDLNHICKVPFIMWDNILTGARGFECRHFWRPLTWLPQIQI